MWQASIAVQRRYRRRRPPVRLRKLTNARKHANADNLWVTCSVDPPRATLRIEDDGGGLGRPRTDSFGLEVMRERAERVGAQLTVQTRPEGGTSVEVTLGARNDR